MKSIRILVSSATLCAVALLCVSSVRGDLVAFYPFDTGPNDASGNGLDGTEVAGPSLQPFSSFDGTASYNFNGTNRVTVPVNLNTMPEATMGAWVRTDTLADGLFKVMGHDNGAWDRVIGLDFRTSAGGGGQAAPAQRYTAFTGTTNNGPIQGTPAPTSTTDWTFLAAVYTTGPEMVTLYIDPNVATTGDALQSFAAANSVNPGAGSTSIGSIAPNNAFEGWQGNIDNAFFYDEALSAADLTALRDGGAAAVLATITPPLPPPPAPRVLQTVYDFESGDLTGWTTVPYGDNLAFADQPSNNSTRGGWDFGKQGEYFIGTYENPGETGSDAPTGILESGSWVLGPYTEITYLIGAGLQPFAGTPAAPSANVAAFNVEREVSPGVWEVIATATGESSAETMFPASFDLRDFEGETVRLRIYDTHTGGWGHINIDDIQISAVPEPTTAVLAIFGAFGLMLSRFRRRRRME